MLNKKIYLAIQAFLVSLFTPLINRLCSLHEWGDDYQAISPAISVVVAYYIVVFLSIFSFKSLEQVRYERAQKNLLKEINKQLGMSISDSKREQLIELREEILSKNLNVHQLYLDACQNDFKKSLEE